MTVNRAFFFIKPHAVNDKVKALVKDTFSTKGIKVISEGAITGKEMEDKKLIDKHYYPLASKATLLKPSELVVPQDKFKEKFGVEWDAALAAGTVYNGLDAFKKLGLSSADFEVAWRKSEAAGNSIKFGGGFYCCKMEVADNGPMYVFNGFFMKMRNGYVCEGASIHYYVVEWDSKACSWADFRGKVLGATDPKKAEAGSLRAVILKDWQTLGLSAEPIGSDNGVHASASPFEATAEQKNWLSRAYKDDAFGKALLDAGIPEATIKNWCKDPHVQCEAPPAKKKSFFDHLEDTNADACLDVCKAVYAGFEVPGIVFVLGGPGAGKGTQCDRIINTFQTWGHVSAGDCLRAERNNPNSKEGAMINEIIKEGKIVPSHITVGLMQKAMSSATGKCNFLIDGFPRNLENVEVWQNVVGKDANVVNVFFFDTSEEVMQERLLERGKTSGRNDDNIEAIKKRFKTYEKETMPIIEKYQGEGLATRFDAGKSIDDVWKEVEAKIKELEAGPLKRKAPNAGSPAKRQAV